MVLRLAWIDTRKGRGTHLEHASLVLLLEVEADGVLNILTDGPDELLLRTQLIQLMTSKTSQRHETIIRNRHD